MSVGGAEEVKDTLGVVPARAVEEEEAMHPVDCVYACSTGKVVVQEASVVSAAPNCELVKVMLLEVAVTT